MKKRKVEVYITHDPATLNRVFHVHFPVTISDKLWTVLSKPEIQELIKSQVGFEMKKLLKQWETEDWL